MITTVMTTTPNIEQIIIGIGTLVSADSSEDGVEDSSGDIEGASLIITEDSEEEFLEGASEELSVGPSV